MSDRRAWLAGSAIVVFARAVTGVRANWLGCTPERRPRIYVANHVSHGDFVLIWSVLPRGLRPSTRPVAGADYWRKGRLRTFLGDRVFRAVLIERHRERQAGVPMAAGADPSSDPVAQMVSALDEGSSLILFPEGTRNMTEEPLLPFRSGLFHVAAARPQVEIVPVWIDNLSRVMPKGEVVPVPLLCTVTFGTPLRLEAEENKPDFLQRVRAAVLELAPAATRETRA